MTPSNACFRQLFYICQQIMDTYDYLPDAEAKYPFCFVEILRTNEQTNSDLLGEFTAYVHFFGERTDRQKLDDALGKLHDELLMMKPLFNYSIKLNKWQDLQIPESSDAPGILHFVADLSLNYNRK